MQVVNLTPHSITVVCDDGSAITYPAPGSGVSAARVAVTSVPAPPLADGCPTVRMSRGDVQDLPAPAPGVLYIVSRMVADAVPDRDDLLVPGAPVRDAHGAVIGCRALVRQ
jgi:hypothetical protein